MKVCEMNELVKMIEVLGKKVTQRKKGMSDGDMIGFRSSIRAGRKKRVACHYLSVV